MQVPRFNGKAYSYITVIHIHRWDDRDRHSPIAASSYQLHPRLDSTQEVLIIQMEMSLHVITRVDLPMRHRTGLSTVIPFPTATELLQKQVNSMNEKKDMGSAIAPPRTAHPSPDTGALSVSAIHPVMNQGFCAHWCVRWVFVVFLGSLWCLYWYSANGYSLVRSFLFRYADASSDIAVNIVSSQDGPLFQSWEYGRS